MAYLVLTLLLSAAALLVAYLNNLYAYWQKRNVPHERPLPVLGNMKGIGRTVHFRDINQRLYERFKRITPIAGLYMFFSKAVLIFDLELIKHILIKDFSSFHNRGLFNNARDDPLTGHLLTLEGDEWRAMRNKLSPTFTSGKMKFMFPTIVAVGERLAKACGTISQTEGGDDGVLELKELSARYTTDVIGTCAFGIECNSLEDPNAEFRQKGRSLFAEPRHSQFVQAFMITNRRLAKRLRMKFFPDHISEFFIGAVRRTVEYRQQQNIKRNDFMDMLIELKAKDATKPVNGIDLSLGLTIEQLAAQAFVFFIAGFDTSSTTMSFCLYELALNQHIQNKLRAEIVDSIKRHDGELSYEQMNELIYLDQVLDETLRKYPLLPHIVRETMSDYPVPNTKYTIEKGTTVLIPVDAIHHDADLYPQPEKFDPERFAPNSRALLERNSAAYLPFGDGPRNCIGMRFGKMQAKVGLVSLLKSYKFVPTKRTEIPLKFSKKNFLLSTENGIYLKAEKL